MTTHYYLSVVNNCCNGRLEIRTEEKTKKLFIECDDCAGQYHNPEDAINNLTESRNVYGTSRPATIAEIISVGWNKYIEQPIKEIIIDGNRFSNEEQFYDYMLEILTFNTFKYDYPQAYQDVFAGGEGWAYRLDEPIAIKWINHRNNKSYFGNRTNSFNKNSTLTDTIIANFHNNAKVVNFEVIE